MCMCLCVCLSVSLHFSTLLHVTWGCPLVVHYWADLQSVHRFRCYDSIVLEREMSSVACTRSMPGFCFNWLKPRVWQKEVFAHRKLTLPELRFSWVMMSEAPKRSVQNAPLFECKNASTQRLDAGWEWKLNRWVLRWWLVMQSLVHVTVSDDILLVDWLRPWD